MKRFTAQVVSVSAAWILFSSSAQAAFTLHIASYRTEPKAEQRATELRSGMPDVLVYGTDINIWGQVYV